MLLFGVIRCAVPSRGGAAVNLVVRTCPSSLVVIVVAALAGCSGRPLGGDDAGGSTGGSSTGDVGTTTGGGGTSGTATGATSVTTGAASTGGATSEAGSTACVECPPPHDLPPEGADCNSWLQDCLEGQKCTLDGGFQAAHCVNVVPGAKGLEEPCTMQGEPLSGFDDCGFGLVCYPVDPDTGQGTCIPICTQEGGPTGCADPARFCTPLCQSCVVGVCVDACDPLADECPEGQICIDAGDGFQCVVDASGAGKQVGEPCQFFNDCGAGLWCAQPALIPDCPPMADGCCTPYCDVGQPVCPGALECVAWYAEGQAPAGLEHVGVCVVPP